MLERNYYMNLKLKEKITESLSAVLPITAIVLVISIVLFPVDLGAIVIFFVGAIMLIIGMGFFQLGAEMAMTPLGEGIGVQMSKTHKVFAILLIGFLMGLIITMSEPDLQVLAQQVPAIPNMTLILTVSVGVGIFLALAIARIIFQVNLSTILIALYIIIIGMSFLVPKDFIGVAFDSGGVTTGPMTVPFIMAMGVGLTSVRGDKNAANDSFGLVALSSIGPVMAVLFLGKFYTSTETAYTVANVASVKTTHDVVRVFLTALPSYAKEVLFSLMPIAVVFFLFQAICHRYHRYQLKRISVGFLYTYFCPSKEPTGANIGFAPVGSLLGQKIALLNIWLLMPIGMIIGYYIVKAEPAIRILNHQVEGVTNGAVSARSMNRCLSVGVSVSIGLSMLRLVAGIPLHRIVVPGYIFALVLSRLVPKMFVGISFDSGGVASGPMTTTFLLPLSIGACEAMGGNLMMDAFGVVSLVALTPLIAVQIMGLQYQHKLNKKEKTVFTEVERSDEIDDIYEFEEEYGDDKPQ